MIEFRFVVVVALMWTAEVLEAFELTIGTIIRKTKIIDTGLKRVIFL